MNIVESKNNSIVAITELSDSNGDIVIASIKMNGKGQVEIDNISKNISANVLTSAYGRENYDYQKKPIMETIRDGWKKTKRTIK